MTGDSSWMGKYYLYQVEVFVPKTGKIETNLVTDPYSVSLSMNSLRSQIVDLEDAALKPAGWDTLAKPSLAAPEDSVIYELHIRDFSITDSHCAGSAARYFHGIHGQKFTGDATPAQLGKSRSDHDPPAAGI